MSTLGDGKHTPYPGADGTVEGALCELDACIEQMVLEDRLRLSPEELLTLSPADILARVQTQLPAPPEGSG
jgi:hypothetical protein